MDEVSSHVCLVLPSTDGKAARKIVPPRLRIPYWKGLGADSEEKHEPVSDIDTVVVDSLKALDPKRPIREADIDGVDMRRRGQGAVQQIIALLGAEITGIGGRHVGEKALSVLSIKFSVRSMPAELVCETASFR